MTYFVSNFDGGINTIMRVQLAPPESPTLMGPKVETKKQQAIVAEWKKDKTSPTLDELTTLDDATKANRFMDAYILKVFEAGKSGYDEWGSSWWGCDATPENVIHRYELEN